MSPPDLDPPHRPTHLGSGDWKLAGERKSYEGGVSELQSSRDPDFYLTKRITEDRRLSQGAWRALQVALKMPEWEQSGAKEGRLESPSATTGARGVSRGWAVPPCLPQGPLGLWAGGRGLCRPAFPATWTTGP